MARLPRLTLPGYPQHIIQRGNNRQACFFDNQDYAVYLDKLKEATFKHGVLVHAFVLMTNHVHLLMTPVDKTGISNVMQNLGRYYVHYINSTYNRTGTLWEGRFKSTIVSDQDYLFQLYRYIELNPVRANMVQHPGDYPWSSYHHNASDKKISLLTPHPLYDSLGNDDDARKQAYRALFSNDIDKQTLKSIRDSTNKGWVLGNSRFSAQISEQLNRRPQPLKQGGDRRSKEFIKMKDFQRT